MLYITSIDDYTVKFHDNGANSQVYDKDLVARADSLDRVWISGKYKKWNALNSCLVSQISLWDGAEYVIYATAADFVSNFNLLMNNEFVEVTTTTTTTV